MSQHARNNPDDPIVHDALAGARAAHPLPTQEPLRTIKVFIPVQLRQLTAHRDTLRLQVSNGVTLRALIDALNFEAPGIKDRLVDATGIRRFITIYLDDKDARKIAQQQTREAREEREREVPLLGEPETDLEVEDIDPLTLSLDGVREVNLLPAMTGG